MDYIDHVTSDGERWDLLAYRYYGDANEIRALAEANPLVPLVPILPGGIRLRIPLRERADRALQVGLPPWKRG